MSATAYHYTSLEPNTSIRLFRIEPKLSDGYVSCTLRQFDGKEFGDIVSEGKECDGTECDDERCFGKICHGEVPPYSALSYFWGDSKHTQKIYLGGYLIGVHETLWEFLHQMQTTQNEKTWFWTDYLCLNQADQTEMSAQVQRMGEIYSEAKETLAWLGREGSPAAQRVEDSTPVKNLEQQLTRIAERVDPSRAAVERFFAKLPNWTTMTTDWLAGSGTVRNGKYDLPHASKEVSQLGHGQLWVHSSLHDVLSLPYWTRVWVVQEVAKAKTVKLAFGSVSIDFDDFMLAYKSYAYYEMMKTRAEVGETMPGSKAAIEARAAVIDNALSMRQMLQWSRMCQASRPIDRIYGLFGLLKTHGLGTSLNLGSLTVDYNKSITSVFWDIVLSCRVLTERKKLELLSRTELRHFFESVSLLADSLGCPKAFSLRELCCYSEGDQSPSLRKMARLTNRMILVLRQIGIGFYFQMPGQCQGYTREPTPHFTPKCRQIEEFGLEMITLFLEYAEFDDVGESGEIHASRIAFELARMARFSGEWTCKPVHNHLENDQLVFDEGRVRRFGYKISLRRAIRAAESGTTEGCSLRDLPTSPEHPGKHHCSGSSLFLWLPDPGFSLRLDFTPGELTTAKLSVTLIGPTRSLSTPN